MVLVCYAVIRTYFVIVIDDWEGNFRGIAYWVQIFCLFIYDSMFILSGFML